jgi:DNA-binding IclR family transcriptional regulator
LNKPRRNIDSKFYVQSIARAFTILDEVSRANDHGLSLSEIAEKISLPISTVYRIVQNLIAWQHLAEKDNGNYTLGFAYLTYGNIVKRDLVLTNYARKHMEDLNQKTKETIYLAILDKMAGDIIYIDKLESHRNIKLAAGVGSHNYIHSTANGKCLVSKLGNDKLRELLAVRGMPALTTNNRHRLRQIRRRDKKSAGGRLRARRPRKRTRSPLRRRPHLRLHRQRRRRRQHLRRRSQYDPRNIDTEYSLLVKEAALNISRQMGYDGRTVAWAENREPRHKSKKAAGCERLRLFCAVF